MNLFKGNQNEMSESANDYLFIYQKITSHYVNEKK